MIAPQNQEESLHTVLTSGFIPEIDKVKSEEEEENEMEESLEDEEENSDEEIEESDRELLKRLGFTTALNRMDGIDTDQDEEEENAEFLTPSQRGYGAVMNEYARMGIGFGDD